ncbi:MAG: hypothetical protein IJE44_03025 [Clostridia bacterium]|nr:hypothetical protein [Clostridia bacterium]
MVCSGCGAHLIDGTPKCPFCKEIFSDTKGASSDMTYKIDSVNQVDLIKNTSRESISLERRRERIRKRRRQRIIGYGILLGLLAVILAVIIGIVSLFVGLFSDKTEYTTVFHSDNGMELYFDENTVTLTDEILASEASDEISLDKEGIVNRSEDGKVTCFLDKYDPKKKQGTLKVIVKDKAKKIKTVAENVSGGFLVSDDGEHILFIKNGNIKGNRGELWYSNKGKKAVKIADKVDKDKVIFSDDFEKVLYIKNYNYKTFYGDAYVASIGDFSEKKVDTEVHALYMTLNNGKTYVYSKNFDDDNETYDLYLNHEGSKTCIATGCGSSPVLSENEKYLFSCGDKNGDRYNLYRINVKKQTAEKIVSNMNEIIKVSEKGKQVFYSKLFENSVGDYYIWSEGETELKVADGVKYTKKNQVAVSEDFKKIAYVANFNEEKFGGSLYHCEYKKDKVSVPEKISDDVYDCYVLNNGKIVYNKNYSSRNKNAQLYIYNGIEDEINKEINPRLLRVFDNNIVCVYDFSSSTGGNLYLIDEDMGEHKLLTDVFGFAQKDNGEFLVIKNKESINNRFDLYETVELKETRLIKKDVEGIILY